MASIRNRIYKTLPYSFRVCRRGKKSDFINVFNPYIQFDNMMTNLFGTPFIVQCASRLRDAEIWNRRYPDAVWVRVGNEYFFRTEELMTIAKETLIPPFVLTKRKY